MKNPNGAPLIGVVLGSAATPGQADAIASRFGRCPFCASFSTLGNSTMGIYALPEYRRWWFDLIAKDPSARLGLEEAEVVFTDAIEASSPWSRCEVKPVLHPAPCGQDCRKCQYYGSKCEGCPATLDYRGEPI